MALRAVGQDVGRRGLVGVRVAEVGLLRAYVLEVRCGADAAGVDGRHRGRHLGVGMRFGQQAPDRLLGLRVVAFAELVVAHAALRIDEVQRGPGLVAERLPDREVVVDGDGPVGVQVRQRLAHALRVVLELELGRVHADDDQALARVRAGPGAHVGQRAQAVDAGIGPEVDQHHLAAQALERERRRVEPAGGAGEAGVQRFDGQGRAAGGVEAGRERWRRTGEQRERQQDGSCKRAHGVASSCFSARAARRRGWPPRPGPARPPAARGWSRRA